MPVFLRLAADDAVGAAALNGRLVKLALPLGVVAVAVVVAVLTGFFTVDPDDVRVNGLATGVRPGPNVDVAVVATTGTGCLSL